jgi:hypothetical protein
MITPERRQELLAASRLGQSVLGAGPAATFSGWNPDLHPHGEHGQWTSTAGQGGLTAATEKPGEVLRAGTSDVPDTLKTASKTWSKAIPVEDRSAIMDFTTGENHIKFNVPLRREGGPSQMSQADHLKAEQLDHAIRSFPAHPPMTSWRGVEGSTPEHTAMIEKSLHAAMATGTPITMNGFTASSLDPGHAAISGKIVLELHSPRGAYLGATARHPETLEMLHTHGDKFRVTGVREDTVYGDTDSKYTAKKKTFILEAVPDAPPPFPAAPKAEVHVPTRLERIEKGVHDWLLDPAHMAAGDQNPLTEFGAELSRMTLDAVRLAQRRGARFVAADRAVIKQVVARFNQLAPRDALVSLVLQTRGITTDAALADSYTKMSRRRLSESLRDCTVGRLPTIS